MSSNFLMKVVRNGLTENYVNDSELLHRFVDQNDQIAFELLVHRHAKTIWTTCRRLLPFDYQAAEDAFQCTVLALARYGKSIRTERIESWLKRVAANASRRLHGKMVCDQVERASPENATCYREEVEILKQEIQLLPEKVRLPLVLCDLAGLTHLEASKQLNMPVATVSKRVLQAREMLRKIFEKRGIALTGLSMTFMADGAADAKFIVNSISAALTGQVSSHLTSVTSGVVTTMTTSIRAKAASLSLVILACGIMTMSVISQEKKAQPVVISGEPEKQSAPLSSEAIREMEREAYQKIKGTWISQKETINGIEHNEIGNKGLITWILEVNDGGIGGGASLNREILTDGRREVKKYECSYYLNPTTNPSQITFFGNGALIQAIYKRDGDKLIVAAYSRPELERVTSFDHKSNRFKQINFCKWEFVRSKKD